MNRSIVMSCIGLVASAIVPSALADTAASSSDPVRCASYAKLVTDHQAFKDGGKTVDGSYDPGDMYDVLKACPSQVKLFKAFYVFFDFIDVQAREDGPKGQGWDPNITDAEQAKVLADLKAHSWKTVNGYKQQIKAGTLDEQALKTTMRYMIWQKTQYTPYKPDALELLARMYPEDYPGVKELAKDSDGTYETWQDTGRDWLPRPAPTKH